MKTIAAGVVVGVLALAACGGGARLSKADFQSKANAICSKYNAKIKGALAGVGNDPASLAKGIDTALGYIEKGTKELDALNPPKQYDAKYKEFSKINHQEIDTGKQLVSAAKAKSSSRIKSSIAQLDSQGKDSDRLAREMGLNTCANG